MKGGIEVKYKWEKPIEHYASKEKAERLRQTVDDKIRKGQTKKWSIIMVDALFVALLLILVGVLDVLKVEMDPRTSLITGIIAFELAIVTFASPIQSSGITKDEVNNIVGIQVTEDIMTEIRKTVERKTSGIERWLAVIGACGVFATLILGLTG